MDSPFQQQLKQLTFKTFYHNQTQTFGYDDLFADRRVIVFSLTQIRTTCSMNQLKSYIDNHDKLINHDIDSVYAIDSTDWLIGPQIDKRTDKIKGLPDRDMKFVEALARHYDYQKSTTDLARFWQYVVILNNGEPEKLWHNPFKENASLVVLKDQKYRYRKLSPDAVVEYLVDNLE